jgi:hypothetical protein
VATTCSSKALQSRIDAGRGLAVDKHAAVERPLLRVVGAAEGVDHGSDGVLCDIAVRKHQQQICRKDGISDGASARPVDPIGEQRCIREVEVDEMCRVRAEADAVHAADRCWNPEGGELHAGGAAGVKSNTRRALPCRIL